MDVCLLLCRVIAKNGEPTGSSFFCIEKPLQNNGVLGD